MLLQSKKKKKVICQDISRWKQALQTAHGLQRWTSVTQQPAEKPIKDAKSQPQQVPILQGPDRNSCFNQIIRQQPARDSGLMQSRVAGNAEPVGPGHEWSWKQPD